MKNKNSAFTLVEVLVATVIGVISILAAFSSYNYFNKSYKSVSQKSAINSSAREALTVIARDLRNAGYIDYNYAGVSKPEIQLIELTQKYLGAGNMDSLVMWYTPSPTDRMKIDYRPMEYQKCKFTTEWCGKYGKGMYLARRVEMNPDQASAVIVYDNFEFVPNIVDFQVVFRDKDGKELFPVCFFCGPVENSQGSNTMVGSYTTGQVKMQKVHTAEIYLTIQSAKEVYKKNKAIRIINHEESSTNGNTQNFDDKYHRETFFISVHTRNLATPKVIAEKTGESIGTGTSYN